ncbi:hypothetical protein V8G54_019117 [Vigna mungo]|uniref:Uncharacterized protein n=1 Tax=Vigna mungo TaxID=3915 RepID=A0AAQ3NAC3_VIGMU
MPFTLSSNPFGRTSSSPPCLKTSPLSASLNTQMNFCLLFSNPVATSLICSWEKLVVVPKDTYITDLSSCLSSHSMQKCCLFSLFSMDKGLNGPRAQWFLLLMILSISSM